MIITISGLPGSGKSTVSKILAERLGFGRYSSGDFVRQLAQESGQDILTFYKNAENNPEIDYKIDQRQKQLGREKDNFVMDGRLSFFFIQHAVKVFLDVSLDVAAFRIFNAKRKGETLYKDVKHARKEISERIENEVKRYNLLYGLNYTDKEHYDLIVDTTNLTPEQIVAKIINFLNCIDRDFNNLGGKNGKNYYK